jgi:hypothetical protein
VSPDGSRFLMIKENERVKPVVVTLNWGDWLNGLGTAGK